MPDLASAMMKETAAKCRAAFAESADMRKLLDLAACDLESAATIIYHSVEAPSVPRPLADWHEDYGEVLWWFFPVREAPYVGSPLCDDWQDYYTHWTPLPVAPVQPKQ
jgi:hypothetical protein